MQFNCTLTREQSKVHLENLLDEVFFECFRCIVDVFLKKTRVSSYKKQDMLRPCQKAPLGHVI